MYMSKNIETASIRWFQEQSQSLRPCKNCDFWAVCSMWFTVCCRGSHDHTHLYTVVMQVNPGLFRLFLLQELVRLDAALTGLFWLGPGKPHLVKGQVNNKSMSTGSNTDSILSKRENDCMKSYSDLFNIFFCLILRRVSGCKWTHSVHLNNTSRILLRITRYFNIQFPSLVFTRAPSDLVWHRLTR